MNIIKSRTVWTLVVMATLGAVQGLQPVMSPELFVVINTILAGVATYFKLKPSQLY